ncbi:MAG: tripartite tricarboxylate transporter substrate-binding protein, partial [Burkholderiales bacterium]
ASGGASAQDYPSQAVRIVVPYPPGGSTDLVARQYAVHLSKAFGQPVIIDNRPGASTNIGAEAVARAKPDGYSLLFAGVNQVLNPVFGPAPSFESTALEPVSLVARIPFIVAANPKVPFNTPKDLITAARITPGKFTISSAQLDVYAALLNRRAEIDLLHVPYKGGAAATTDAISGQVDMVYALVPVLLPHIQGGRLKAVALTGAKRSAALPSTMTFVESGIDYDVSIWYGLMAPAGMPKATLNRIAQAAQRIVSDPEFAQKLLASGADAVSNTPEEFSRQVETEIAFWRRLAASMPNLVTGNAGTK